MSLGDIFTSKSTNEFMSNYKDYASWELGRDWDMNKEWITAVFVLGLYLGASGALIKAAHEHGNSIYESEQMDIRKKENVEQISAPLATKIECPSAEF